MAEGERGDTDAQDDGDLPLFGKVEGGARHVEGFLRIGRLEERAAGEPGEGAVVLLVLGGVHGGVVRRHEDESANRADAREGHERVHGHVQADVLHGDDGAGARQRGADGDFQGDFFVDGPLGLDFAAEFGDGFEDFGGGGAGVGGGDGTAGMPSGPGDGFVGGEEFFHRASFRKGRGRPGGGRGNARPPNGGKW